MHVVDFSPVGALPTPVGALPTPAAVLTIGRLAHPLATDLRDLFLHGDSRRSAVTTFLALTPSAGCDPGDGWTLLPLAEWMPPPTHDPEPQRAANEATHACVTTASDLRRTLTHALRSLRTAERLQAAGLGDARTPPLDVILVADLTDAEAQGALLPMLDLVQDILAQDPHATGHLLLSIADFDPAEDDAHASRMAVLLHHLNARLEPGSPGATNHPGRVLSSDSTLDFYVYLFDRGQEGSREVKDAAELQVIMGNLLLALLCGGLADSFRRRNIRHERQERKAYFAAAGVAALHFEPTRIAQLCATRLTADFLDAELLLDRASVHTDAWADSSAPARGWAERVNGQLGDLDTWLARVLQDTPFVTRPARGHITLDIALPPFNSDSRPAVAHLAPRSWATALRQFDQQWRATRLPEILQTLQFNVLTLHKESVGILDSAVDALPRDPRVYPNGLVNAQRALQILQTRLQGALRLLENSVPQVGPDPAADLQALAQAAARFPGRALFVTRLLLGWLLQGAILVALGRELGLSSWLIGWIIAVMLLMTTGLAAARRMRQARWLHDQHQQCRRNLERSYAATLAEVTHSALRTLYTELLSRLDAGDEALRTLIDQVMEAKRLLAARPVAADTHASLLRRSPADAAFIQWAYATWRHTPDAMRTPFLQEAGLLDDWRTLRAETIVARGIAYSLDIFRPVAALTLNDVLARKSTVELRRLANALRCAAILPLRPRFDHLGGGAYAQRQRYLLLPGALAAGLPDADDATARHEEQVRISDPNLLLACAVCHLIPLAAVLPRLPAAEEWTDIDSPRPGSPAPPLA